jgi:TolB-like protein
MKKSIFLIIMSVIILSGSAIAQTRIAVFPFQNKDGDSKFNVWCFDLQDSLYKALLAEDPESAFVYIVPPDSVEFLLTELNMDPGNPQYDSDMWTVAKQLNVKKVITGNFNYQAERFLINAYIYDVRTKLAHPQYQARDIFKSEEYIYESIPIILESILGYFMKNN